MSEICWGCVSQTTWWCLCQQRRLMLVFFLLSIGCGSNSASSPLRSIGGNPQLTTLCPEEICRQYVPLPKQTYWASHVPRRRVTTRGQADSPKRVRSVGSQGVGKGEESQRPCNTEPRGVRLQCCKRRDKTAGKGVNRCKRGESRWPARSSKIGTHDLCIPP